MNKTIAYLGTNDTFRKLLSSMLSSAGYDVAAFTSPAALAAAVPASSFTALLVDTTNLATLPHELLTVVGLMPTVLLQPPGGDGPTPEGICGPVILERPLSIPRLLKILAKLGGPCGTPQQGIDSKTALVVDDDPSFRMYVEEILKTIGYKVYTAGDGIEALELLDTIAEPSAFVLDLEMPRMDGPTLIGRLNERFEHPSILIMTGTTNLDLVRWGRTAGAAYGLIEKPFASRTFLRYFGGGAAKE